MVIYNKAFDAALHKNLYPLHWLDRGFYLFMSKAQEFKQPGVSTAVTSPIGKVCRGWKDDWLRLNSNVERINAREK